jgi:mevalonate kinase
MIEASAPAKIILFGEHAVVYGQPAIAVPVSSLRVTASVKVNQADTGLRIHLTDNKKTSPVEISAAGVDDVLVHVARLVLGKLAAPPPNVTILISSQIPIASGLGSGAAVSTALARALSTAVGKPLPVQILNELVYEAEKFYHGNPSGIDNTTIVYEQPVYFIRGRPMETITIRSPFTLIIGDTGKSALTKLSVGDVRQLYESDRPGTQAILDAIGSLVVAARRAIENGDIVTLGSLMTQNHAYLRQLKVSSPELESLVESAVEAGALGAKLSGGGRGGNMIALVKTPKHVEAVQNALMKAGAAHVFQTRVEATGKPC